MVKKYIIRLSETEWSLLRDIFILTALCTGIRRGELLNATWQDIDFADQKMHVSPKQNTESTWEWRKTRIVVMFL